MADDHRDALLVETDGPVTVLTLNRPDRLNALDRALLDELVDELRRLAADPRARCLVVTGAGRAFCAGGDLTMSAERRAVLASGDPIGPVLDDQLLGLEHHAEIASLLATMPKPTIGAARGHAIGGGLAILLGCDLRIGAADTTLRAGYASAGLSGDLGITPLLVGLVGAGRARQILLLDEAIGADAALDLGLLTSVVPPDDLMPAAMDLAQRLAAGPTMAYGKIKRNVWRAAVADYDALVAQEAVNVRLTALSRDAVEAGEARTAGRRPTFEGR
jgi:2-(1,2-epoxy-1,2-dihydrophenyl)acetyl-CoA isomerase